MLLKLLHTSDTKGNNEVTIIYHPDTVWSDEFLLIYFGSFFQLTFQVEIFWSDQFQMKMWFSILRKTIWSDKYDEWWFNQSL